MNIVAKCKGYFPKATCDPITSRPLQHPQFQQFLLYYKKHLASAIELHYEQQLAQLEAKYEGTPAIAVSFFKQSWLIP